MISFYLLNHKSPSKGLRGVHSERRFEKQQDLYHSDYIIFLTIFHSLPKHPFIKAICEMFDSPNLHHRKKYPSKRLLGFFFILCHVFIMVYSHIWDGCIISDTIFLQNRTPIAHEISHELLKVFIHGIICLLPLFCEGMLIYLFHCVGCFPASLLLHHLTGYVEHGSHCGEYMP